MADLKEDKIDFGKLEKELFAAVDADASYWRENDAKLRAMNQRVETYDQFKDMVAAAHIKPLDKKDKFGQGKRKQPWNPFSSSASASSSSSTSTAHTDDSLESSSAKGVSIPKNGHEFTKEWRKKKKTPGDCYAYLLEIGGDALAKVFKAEISFGLLGDMIGVLDEHAAEGDSGKVADILMCLTRAGRFGLSLDFLSTGEKQKLSDLVSKLEDWTKQDTMDSGATDTCDNCGESSECGSNKEQENLVNGESTEEKDVEKDHNGASGMKCVGYIDIKTLRTIYKLEEK